MVQKKGSKTLFKVFMILGVLLVISVVVIVVRLLSASPAPAVTDTAKKDTPAVSGEADKTETPPKDTSTDNVEPAIDPATVSTVSIDPMMITVSYVKGIGGFDFEVLRTPGGTKYVQFSSEKLVGTKCTNDKGPFASIIDSPLNDESAVLAKKVVVDGTTYGLSLVDETCTSDASLLKQYQDSFSSAFSLLKKM